jgi:DNA-binding Lrp family transcriptional regulator
MAPSRPTSNQAWPRRKRFLVAKPAAAPLDVGDPLPHFGETTMDDLDQRLIAALRENARLSTSELGRRLGLSRTTVQSRIERLERRGVIIGYTARLSEDHERGALRAHVMITVRPKEARAVEAALRALPGVRVLHSVSGVFDLIAQVAALSTAEMDDLVDTIGDLPGVERTTSSIVLSTKFER